MLFRQADETDLDDLIPLATQSFYDYPLFSRSIRKYFKNSQQYRMSVAKVQRYMLSEYLRYRQGIVCVDRGRIVGAAFVSQFSQKPFTLKNRLLAGEVRLFPEYLSKHFWHLQRVQQSVSYRLHKSMHTHDWQIESIFIYPQYQHHGYALVMIEQGLLPELRKLRGQKLIAVAYSSQARSFFLAAGFTGMNSLKHDSRQCLPYWVMQRPIVASNEQTVSTTQVPKGFL